MLMKVQENLCEKNLKFFLYFRMNAASLCGCIIYGTDWVNAGTLQTSKYNPYVITNCLSFYAYEQELGSMSTMKMWSTLDIQSNCK
jgi:hypothetical protein